MKAEDVKRLYDSQYASSYEEKYLRSRIAAADACYELKLLRSLLTSGTRWLDVACGTGYFLRHFPEVERTGLDLSPAMLERARAGNPDAELVERDFRHPIPDWVDRFGLVSCMWYAYCYVDTVAELVQVIGNLASWTAPSGCCFVPLADPSLIAQCAIPYHRHTHHLGELSITGILWSYAEEDGNKAHAHLLSPNIEFMRERFGEWFESVEIIKYPLVTRGIGRRPALLATRKRPKPQA